MDTFTSLPPEIRNMIYNLLLVQHSAIPICSPRRLWAMNRNSTTATANFFRLILVNKQIHNEACTLFYSLNSFIIGNGNYGSSMETNIHALKSFTRRVPAQYIACISRLTILMYLRNIFYTAAPNLGPWTSVTKYGICSTSDASDLQAISRGVVRHFKGVESVVLNPCVGGPQRSFDGEPRLCREGSIEEITKAVKLLLKHPKLKEMEVGRKDYLLSQLQEAAEKAVKETKCMVRVKFETNV